MSWLLLILACGAPVAPAPGGEAPAPVVAPVAAPATSGNPIVDAMRRQPITYTHHGRCRMDCRKISEKEVAAILKKDGVLKPERSREDGECPTHGLEGVTEDGQEVRIVFAACADESRVVTAIDLDTDWPCDCD